MRMLDTILHSGKGRAVLTAIAAYVAWQLWLTLEAPGKVTPSLWARAPRVDVLVTLPFPPSGSMFSYSNNMAASPAHKTIRSRCAACGKRICGHLHGPIG